MDTLTLESEVNLSVDDVSVGHIANAIAVDELPALLHKENHSNEIFHDSQTWKDELNEPEEEFFDVMEMPENKQVSVDDFLEDLTYHQLTGKSKPFNTLICAIQTSEQLQNLEAIQPNLAWKPLEVIRRTLHVTTQ